MVEHTMVDPETARILDSDLSHPPLARGGTCLVCGDWVPSEEQNMYLVTLERPHGPAADFVAHPACLERVVHPSAALPGAPTSPDRDQGQAGSRPEHEGSATSGAGGVSADSLDQKPLTPDGR